MVQSCQQAYSQGLQGSYGDSGSLFGAFTTWRRYELHHSELGCFFWKGNNTGERKCQEENYYVDNVVYLATIEQYLFRIWICIQGVTTHHNLYQFTAPIIYICKCVFGLFCFKYVWTLTMTPETLKTTEKKTLSGKISALSAWCVNSVSEWSSASATSLKFMIQLKYICEEMRQLLVNSCKDKLSNHHNPSLIQMSFFDV